MEAIFANIVANNLQALTRLFYTSEIFIHFNQSLNVKYVTVSFLIKNNIAKSAVDRLIAINVVKN